MPSSPDGDSIQVVQDGKAVMHVNVRIVGVFRPTLRRFPKSPSSRMDDDAAEVPLPGPQCIRLDMPRLSLGQRLRLDPGQRRVSFAGIPHLLRQSLELTSK